MAESTSVGDGSTASPAAASGPPVVLQVLPSLVTGGVERGTVDMARALVDAGWQAVVASSGGPMVRELERAGARHEVLPLQSKNPMVMRANVDRLSTLIADCGAHIVHARSRAPAWSARAAAKRTGAHFMTTFHGTYNGGVPLKRLYNSIMTRGERVIAISEFIAAHIRETYNVDTDRIRVVHRGVDIDRFDPRRVSAERIVKLAREWRLPDDAPVVMLPGRLTRWKGQAVLIRALAAYRGRGVRCLLIGDDQGRTAYRRELDALVDSLGLEGVVHMVGHCSDMPAALMLADVVVSASTDPEAFGRVMVEAQAMGKPVIASDHGASRELVLERETGWLFPPGDAAALAATLEAAVSLDAGQREALAAQAMAHVRRHFTKDRMCAATLDVYSELLQDAALTADVAA